MRAGTLRNRVNIQAPVENRTDDGGFCEDWYTVGSAYAGIYPLRGREFFENQASNSDITHEIEMRVQIRVHPEHRIVFGRRIFNVINSVDVAERGISQKIMAKEVTS